MELLRAIRRVRTNANLIVLGYASAVDMAMLRDWVRLEIAPPSGFLASRRPFLPLELDALYYTPLHRLLVRPESRDGFTTNETFFNSFAPEADLWRATLSAVRRLLEQNTGRFALEVISKAWADRLSDSSRAQSERILWDSGLFFRSLRGLDNSTLFERGSPVAEAISAYLDGLTIATTDLKRGLGRQVYEINLKAARSMRRLPIEAPPRLAQLTSWLAMVVAVHEASDRRADAIINDVAGEDLNVAMDLYDIRTQVTSQPVGTHNLVSRIVRHASTHGNAIPLLFPRRLDVYAHPSAPTCGKPKTQEANRILTRILDLDLLTCLLASCAIVGKSSLIQQWRQVVPSKMRKGFDRLAMKLKAEAVKIQSGSKIAYVSVRPISVAELNDIFPSIGRCHQGDETAVLPWLSAYVLAHGCGGRLPLEGEFAQIAANRDIQRAILARDRPSSSLPPYDLEWLTSIDPASEVKGDEFQGVAPRVYQRVVGRVSWYKSEADDEITAGPPDTNLAARPGLNLAACRVVFDPP